jgi:hypothetical protein
MAIRALILLMLLTTGSAARAEQLLVEFRGGNSQITAPFEVRGPWLLDWRVSNREGYELGCEVALEEAGTRVHRGRVLAVKGPSNGLRLFAEGGRLQFRVDATFADWTLKVIQLTPAEALKYEPRQGFP